MHEVNRPVEPEVQGWTDLQIFHFADKSKTRSQYLPLLLADLEESPNNDRQTYYTARELFFHNRFEEATKLFKRHLTMPESVWPPERAWSMRYLAKMHPDEALHWHMRACAEYPTGAETWTDLGSYCYRVKDWFGMYYAAKRALDCQLYKGLYLTEPDAYGWWPRDMAALSAYNLGLYHEALLYGQIAVDMNPTDQRLQENLKWYKKALTKVSVVIPTKSNIQGLTTLISALIASDGVSRVIVVGDGTETEGMLKSLPSSIIKTYVARGAGITAMWNAGMALATEGSHVLFLNDDVTINDKTVGGLIDAVVGDPRIGLVCPHYANTPVQPDIETTTVCQGRYDGTGGMAGFAMMLTADLVSQYQFDERMKWWYSDDDLVNWVVSQGRKCVITEKATCHHAHSQTITNDPPADFAEQFEKDRLIYEKKWSK